MMHRSKPYSPVQNQRSIARCWFDPSRITFPLKACTARQTLGYLSANERSSMSPVGCLVCKTIGRIVCVGPRHSMTSPDGREAALSDDTALEGLWQARPFTCAYRENNSANPRFTPRGLLQRPSIASISVPRLHKIDKNTQRCGQVTMPRIVEKWPRKARPPRFENRLQRAAIQIRTQNSLEQVNHAH